MTQLISISEVLDGAWKLTKDHWRACVKPLLQFVGLTVAYIVGVNVIPFTLGSDEAMSGLAIGLTFVIMVAYMLAILWPTLTLTSMFLQFDGANPAVTPEKVSLGTIGSILLIAIITFFAVGAASIFLILPGIWLAVAIQFSDLVLIEDGKTGMDAIKTSFTLVKGRWWKTFWRLAIPHVVVQILISLVLIAVVILSALIIGLVFGGGAVAGNAIGSMGFLRGTNVVGGILAVIFGLAFLGMYLAAIAASVLVSLGIQTKLFHSLKATRMHPEANA